MFRIKYLAAALAVSSGSAMAAADFQGFYGQLGVGYESISPKTSLSGSVNGNSANAIISDNSSNSFTGNFGIGYMAKITDGFLLGVGADYSPIQSGKMSTSGVINWKENGVSESANYSGKAKKENSYSFFLSPATTIGERGLIYGKVGYAGAQFSEDGHKETMHGVLVGLGLKQVISGGIYGFVEGNYVKYKDKSISGSFKDGADIYSGKTTYGGSSYNLMAGIGYKF